MDLDPRALTMALGVTAILFPIVYFTLEAIADLFT
jgi:hypothetical protein